MEEIVGKVFSVLKKYRFKTNDEIELHNQMAEAFEKNNIQFTQEVRLNSEDIVDFMIDGKIALEVKIKGRPVSIFRQCERYCKHDKVESLVLVSSKAMGFPKEINGKATFFFNLNENALF